MRRLSRQTSISHSLSGQTRVSRSLTGHVRRGRIPQRFLSRLPLIHHRHLRPALLHAQMRINQFIIHFRSACSKNADHHQQQKDQSPLLQAVPFVFGPARK